jgi:hypothetical protein
MATKKRKEKKKKRRRMMIRSLYNIEQEKKVILPLEEKTSSL